MVTRSAMSVPVGALTDAELALLTRPRTRIGPRPVMPVWSRLEPDLRVAALRQARVSLVSRRLLEPGARPGARSDVRSLLALRAAATAVVSVVRTTAAARDHWYAHVVRDVVLVEQVSADGVHHFRLTDAATLPELVVAAVLHPVPGLLRTDLELRTLVGTRRWAGGPDTPEPDAADDVRRQVRDALAELDPFELDGAG